MIPKPHYPDARLLRTGDMIHCDGGPDTFSTITRIVTGPKNQNIIQRIRNHDISTHTGVIAEWEGQRFVIEMRPNGLENNAIEFYRKPFSQAPRNIIRVTRPVYITDAYRSELSAAMALDVRRGKEYALKDLPRFVIRRIKADKKRMYCSEYVYYLYYGELSTGQGENLLPDAPLDFQELVSPEQLMQYTRRSDRHLTVWDRAWA